MSISRSFEAIDPEPIKIDGHEPDVPKFRFGNAEREKMIKEEGMTEEQIVAAEAVANNKLAISKRSQEMKAVQRDDQGMAA